MKHLMPLILRVSKFALISFLWLWVGVVWASPTATLTGRITNPLGGVLGGAQIEAKNIETGTVSMVKSGQNGLYRIPGLPPGTYRIIVRMFGYKTIVKPGVRLHVQDVIGLNFAMQIGSVISSITEEEGTPLLQAETVTQGTTISQVVITELPSLTRNPYDFVALGAGATSAGVTRGIGFAINGQRAESGSFLLDGSDNNDPYETGPGQIVPLDAVQEYRLMTSNYPAEYGRNVGFVANVVTRGGTNDFHGVAYDFVRNSSFASNTFENNARGISRPEFNRHQLGGTLGGPVVRDKLFFFTGFEAILVRSSAAVSYYVPTPELLAISSSGTNAIFKRFPVPTGFSTTDVSMRTVCPFGRICGSNINSGYVTIPAFASSSRTGPIDAGAGAPQDTYLLTNKLDYSASQKLTLNARYAFQQLNQFATINQPYSPLLDRPSFTSNQNVTLNLTRFWHGNFYTESRIVYNRLTLASPGIPQGSFPSFAITGDTVSGAARSISIPSGRNAFGGPQNIYQFYLTANWIRNDHNLKFGGYFLHLRDNRLPTEVTATRSNQGEFRDLAGFISGQLATFQLSLDPQGQVPGGMIEPPFDPSSSSRHLRFNDFGGFLQDFWKQSSRMTISPGVRYEYFGQGHRVGYERPLDSNFYYGSGSTIFQRIANGSLLPLSMAPGEYRNRYFLPSFANIGPRLGLAYDVKGDGRSVLRLGAGVFFERLPGLAYENLNPPSQSVTRLTNIRLTQRLLDNPYSVFGDSPMPLPPSAVIRFDQDLTTSKTISWNATYEHEVFRNLLLGASYIGSRGQHLYRFINDNRIGSGQFDGRPEERLFSSAASFLTLDNLGDSSYHGLQLRIESLTIRHLGLQAGVNYTWSHSIDNVSSLAGDDAAGGGGLPLNPFNVWMDRGSSDHDVRHRLVSHFIWNIPGFSGFTGFKKVLLAGWQISGILSYQTGQPFSLKDNRVFDRDIGDNTRPRVTGLLPRVLTGEDIVPDARTPNAFLVLPMNPIRTPAGDCIVDAAPLACLPSVNGPYINVLGRNTFRRPGTQYQNIAFIKNFDLPAIARREGLVLQCRAEFYNAFNHSNLYFKVETGNVAATSFNAANGSSLPGVIASFGTPERFPQEARQIVMALKLIF